MTQYPQHGCSNTEHIIIVLTDDVIITSLSPYSYRLHCRITNALLFNSFTYESSPYWSISGDYSASREYLSHLRYSVISRYSVIRNGSVVLCEVHVLHCELRMEIANHFGHIHALRIKTHDIMCSQLCPHINDNSRARPWLYMRFDFSRPFQVIDFCRFNNLYAILY